MLRPARRPSPPQSEEVVGRLPSTESQDSKGVSIYLAHCVCRPAAELAGQSMP